MAFVPYLTFGGDCAEAFDFYKSVFGGDYEMRSTFAEGPEDMNVRDEDKSKIMHVTLMVDGAPLMGSDTTSDHGGPVDKGNNISISYAPKNRESADEIFGKLSAGGHTIMPMHDAFWGAYFGMCTDKFGVNWMLSMETGG